ncbi:carbohydrate kinase family protein [Burkholderia sp. Bp9125]|nr:carbohydrate kinase family protein [Burkholderia sp. Bp9125]
MKRQYLLAGSYAYDTVLRHPHAFQQRILPHAIDKLNVSFSLDSVAEEFGGCAGNIAYNAALLWDEPMLVGNVGADGERYLKRLESWGLDNTTLGFVPDRPTAHAWLLSDARGNQLTSFHAGALKAPVRVPAAAPDLWHIGPEDQANMVTLALAAREAGASYFFDPGQALPALLDGVAEDIAPLEHVLADATGIFVNEYETELLRGQFPDLRTLLIRPDQFIVCTRGADGVEVLSHDGSLMLPCAKADAVVDPTGCGDAFRAGFLHGYARDWSLADCAALGSVMGALAVGSVGGQNHRATRVQVYARLRDYQETQRKRAA